MVLSRRAAKLATLLAIACTAVFATVQSVQAAWPGGNGKIVFWRAVPSPSSPVGFAAQIYSMDSQGGHQVNLSAAGGGADQINIQPSVSPNGKRIAFVRGVLVPQTPPNPPLIVAQIFTMGIDGTDQTDVTNDLSTTESGPAWTEDGSSILFVKQPVGTFPGVGGSIWVRKASGGGTPRQLTFGVFDANPAMSPDGDLLAFSRIDFSDPLPPPPPGAPPGFWRHLMVMKSDGSEAPQDLGRGSKPDWSPDSKRLVYGQAGTGPIMVVKVADPSDKRKLADVGSEAPAWSPDGTMIVFLSCFGPGACEVALMTATGQNQHTITNDVPQGMGDQKPDWQPVRGEGGERGG